MPLVNILALKVSPHLPSINKSPSIPQCGVFTTVCVSRNSINNPLPHIHPSFVFTKTWACFTISMPLILSQSLCVGRSQVSLYMDIPMLIQFILARCRQSTTCNAQVRLMLDATHNLLDTMCTPYGLSSVWPPDGRSLIPTWTAHLSVRIKRP